MAMTVYVLLRGFECEGADAIGAYSTREKAAEAEAADRDGIEVEGGGSYWVVKEFQVDAPSG